jgi:hypothetical protein
MLLIIEKIQAVHILQTYFLRSIFYIFLSFRGRLNG